MMKKYEQLKEMLTNNEYNLSCFDDISIVDEFFMVDTKIEDLFVSVYVTDEEKFNVVVEENKGKEYDYELNNNYETIENKNYKSVKGAYNFIVKYMGK